MSNIRDQLTKLLLVYLPRPAAIGIVAILTALFFVLVASAVIFALVLLGKSIIDQPPLVLVYFAIFTFGGVLWAVTDDLLTKYPSRKSKDE